MSSWRKPGHRHLPDGELLRLDPDYRHADVFEGAEFWPDRVERRHVRGSFEDVASTLELWESEVGS